MTDGRCRRDVPGVVDRVLGPSLDAADSGPMTSLRGRATSFVGAALGSLMLTSPLYIGQLRDGGAVNCEPLIDLRCSPA